MSTVPRLGSTTMALANRHVKIQDDINTGMILTCLLCHGFSLVKAANCSSTKDQETSWLLRICLKAADCPAVLFRWYQLSTVLSVTKKEVKEKRLPNTLGNLLPLGSIAPRIAGFPTPTLDRQNSLVEKATGDLNWCSYVFTK